MLRAWNDITIGCALLSYAYDLDEPIDTLRICSNDVIIWLLDIARTIMHVTTRNICDASAHWLQNVLLWLSHDLPASDQRDPQGNLITPYERTLARHPVAREWARHAPRFNCSHYFYPNLVDMNDLRTLLLPRNQRRAVDFSFFPEDDDVFGRTRARIPAPILLGSVSDDESAESEPPQRTRPSAASSSSSTSSSSTGQCYARHSRQRRERDISPDT